MAIHPVSMRRFCTLLGACVGLTGLVAMAHGQSLPAADAAAARQLRERAQTSGLAYELATSLTTEVGPRLSGTPGDQAGVAWAVRTFERLGFANVRTMEVTVPRWARGTAELRVLEPFPQSIPAVALGGSVSTPDEGLVAELLPVKDLNGLAAVLPDGVAGRIVYFSHKMERTVDASGYGRAVPVRTQGPAAASAKGAAAVVIRSISTSDNRLAHTGVTGFGDAPPIPAVAISNPDADQLDRIIASGHKVKLELRVTARELPPAKSANVIAEIPGTDRADEIVLLGAHLDSWDLGTGAIDDAAGVAIVTAAAHLLRDVTPKPRRTIRVVLFANEENGLMGARTYAEQESASLAKHAVAMEADLGAGPPWRLSSNVASTSLPVVRSIHSVLQVMGIALGGNTASGGADISPLRTRGVPVLSIDLDATSYFDHHHSANDTLDKIDPQALAQSVAAYAVAAYLAARTETPWARISELTTSR